MIHHLSIDLETYSAAPLKDTGLYRYVEDPTFEILLFAYSVDGQPVQIIDLAQGEAVPQELISALYDPAYLKHAYNAPFEFACLSKCYGKLIPAQWRCTMFHGLYAGYTAGLEATGAALGLAEDKKKLKTGKALIDYFSKPCRPTKTNGQRTRNYPKHDPEKWRLFKEYCWTWLRKWRSKAGSQRFRFRHSYKSSGKRTLRSIHAAYIWIFHSSRAR